MDAKRRKWLGHGLVLSAALALSACGKSEKTPAKAPAAKDGKTTASAAAPAPNVAQSPELLELETEKYLSPEDRMHRRQQRLEAVLQGP